MAYLLDLTGFHCPVPLLMADKAIQSLAVGEQIILHINDRTSLQDLQLLCEQKGYQICAIEPQNGGGYQLRVRK